MRLDFRKAVAADVPTLVALLADDPLGATREQPELPLARGYAEAFAAIDHDPHQHLIVAEAAEGVRSIVGFLQLTLIPYLTYGGRWRALIEGVRVSATQRGRGVGRALFDHAIQIAVEQGCHVVQLTTDKRRPRAIRFYEELGFEATHEGMKLHLPQEPEASR